MSAETIRQGVSLAGRVLARTVPFASGARYLISHGPSPEKGPILVAIHGIGRDPDALIHVLSDAAQQHGFTLIAPQFDERRYQDFQRLGRTGLGERADLALNDILDDAESLLGLKGKRHIFGFSGGAQFAHRYVSAWPGRFETATLVAAGWYSNFSRRRQFPRGLAPTSRLPGITFDASALLRTPTHVIVGENDTKRDGTLRQSKRLDAQQGANRVARAKWFYRQLQKRSRRHGLNTDHKFTILKNCGHDAVEAAVRGNLSESVFDHILRNSPGH